MLDETQVTYYQPSDKERALVGDIISKFRTSADERNRAYEYFDGRTLIEYINDSVRRFTTNVDVREGIEDWQARVHDQFTRNKVLAVLGKVVSVLPIASYTPRGDEDIRITSILTELYQYSEDKEDFEEFALYFLEEAIVKGTAIGYEGVEYSKKTVRDVTGIGDEIKEKESIVEETRLFSELVPLEEFYPSSVSIRTIKEMPYCFRRKEYSFGEFQSRFSNYSKSVFVKPFDSNLGAEEKPFYLDYISSTTTPGNVEVIWYFDKMQDMHVIIANGIWINPIDNEVISPIPFNHKQLPFYDIKFDIIGPWFYGKSLPDRLKSFQDVLNVLTNMTLDQSFLTIFPPLLTNGFDRIEDDYLRPGRRTPIDTQGLPINQAFMKLDLGVPSGWHQFILEYTRRVMEEASIDRVSSGHAGAGDRTTAQEIRVAAEGVASTLGIFGRFINYGLKQKALLRGKNILQFWTDPNKPMLKGILGSNGDELFAKAFNTFKINNTVLSDGKRGTHVIMLFADQEDMPDAKSVETFSKVKKVITGKDIEYTPVSASYIRNIEFDTKMVMDTKKEATRDLDKAIQLEKVRVYLGLFPQGVFDLAELAAQTAEKMGDDPTKVLSQDTTSSLITRATSTESAKPMSQNPSSNIMTNMADTGSSGISGGMQSLAQLGGSMLG